MRICRFSWKVTMAKANKSPEAEQRVPVNAQNSSSGGRRSFTWLHSRVFHGEGHLFGSNKSPFQTLAEALYIGRTTRVDKVFMTLCRPVQVKSKRGKQKQIKPFLLPRRSVIWFLFASWMFFGKEHAIWQCPKACWQSSDIIFCFHCLTRHEGSHKLSSQRWSPDVVDKPQPLGGK